MKVQDILAAELAKAAGQPQAELIAVLRTAATLLADSGGYILFPSWDYGTAMQPADAQPYMKVDVIERTNRIRDAAFAILGRGNVDGGQAVEARFVADLVRYIGDLQEQ